jgi:hypothetical protein
VYLEFGKTDGDAKQLPTNTREVVDADGQVNYMKPLGLDDSSNVHWRCQVAMKIAERIGETHVRTPSFVASVDLPIGPF